MVVNMLLISGEDGLDGDLLEVFWWWFRLSLFFCNIILWGWSVFFVKDDILKLIVVLGIWVLSFWVVDVIEKFLMSIVVKLLLMGWWKVIWEKFIFIVGVFLVMVFLMFGDMVLSEIDLFEYCYM